MSSRPNGWSFPSDWASHDWLMRLMGKEMTREARLRRLRDTLIIAGDGVIAFGAWSMAKTMLFLVLTEDAILREIFSLDERLPLVAVYVMTGFMLCIDLGIRSYVGLSARSEGRGKRKRALYLIVAMLAATANAYSVVAVFQGTAVTMSALDTAISVVIESMAAATLLLVIYCSIRLRQLRSSTE